MRGQKSISLVLLFVALLTLAAAKTEAQVATGTPPQVNQLSEAAEAWNATKDTTNIAVLEAFVERYSSTFFATLARARIDELKAGSANAQPKVADVPVVSAPTSLDTAQPRDDIARRVVLYDEDPSNPKGHQYVGSVTWHTEPVKMAAGQQDIAVRGDIEVPDRKLKMRMTLRRNFDRKLPASHTVELSFKLPPDFVGGGVSNVPGILMKAHEQARGAPLAALAVKVTDGFFLVGMSDKDRGANLELLRDQAWFDIPMVYNNQRRAILAIEKSDPAFEAALTAWDRDPAGVPVTSDKP